MRDISSIDICELLHIVNIYRNTALWLPVKASVGLHLLIYISNVRKPNISNLRNQHAWNINDTSHNPYNISCMVNPMLYSLICIHEIKPILLSYSLWNFDYLFNPHANLNGNLVFLANYLWLGTLEFIIIIYSVSQFKLSTSNVLF